MDSKAWEYASIFDAPGMSSHTVVRFTHPQTALSLDLVKSVASKDVDAKSGGPQSVKWKKSVKFEVLGVLGDLGWELTGTTDMGGIEWFLKRPCGSTSDRRRTVED